MKARIWKKTEKLHRKEQERRKKVKTEYPTPGQNLARDRVWGSFATGGSQGIRGSHQYVRQGGALARELLIEAAADAWEVPVEECSASESVITYLKHHSRPLIFTASLPPASTAGILAALDIIEKEKGRRERLWTNAWHIQEGFRSLGFDVGDSQTPIVPVLIGPLEQTFLFWRKLFDAGVFTNPVIPPAVPPEGCRLRTSVMATHTAEQIDLCLEAFHQVGRELGVI